MSVEPVLIYMRKYLLVVRIWDTSVCTMLVDAGFGHSVHQYGRRVIENVVLGRNVKRVDLKRSIEIGRIIKISPIHHYTWRLTLLLRKQLSSWRYRHDVLLVNFSNHTSTTGCRDLVVEFPWFFIRTPSLCSPIRTRRWLAHGSSPNLFHREYFKLGLLLWARNQL